MSDDVSTSPHQEQTRQTIRTMSLGTVWRILRYPFILISLAVIPRLMGDVDYGIYAYFISLYVILNACTDIGFLQIFGRFVPECEAANDRARTIGLLRGLFGFGLLLAALMAIGVSISYLVNPWTELPLQAVAILSLLLILTRVEGTFFNFIYGMNQIARFSAKEMLRSAITLVLVVLFYRWFGLLGAFWALAVNELILALIGGVWAKSSITIKSRRFTLAELKPYILFGVGFFFPALLLGLLQRVGNVLVQAWSGKPEQVAYYDIANQYLLLTATFIGLILQTLLPSLAKLKVTNQHAAMERWQRVVMAYCAALGFLSINALMWLGEPLILIWLGETFHPVVENAKIVSLAIIPALIAYAGMNYALLEKTARTYVTSVGVAMILMVGVSFWLVPANGATGAAWATVVAYWGMGLVFLFRYYAHFRATLDLFWLAVIIGALFSALYLLPVGYLASLFMFGLSSVGFILMLLLFKVISLQDLQKIARGFKKPRG
jgi:O-antigen/teichoic acid export membrane protein